MEGGEGADWFFFDTAAEEFFHNIVTDFEARTDKIVLWINGNPPAHFNNLDSELGFELETNDSGTTLSIEGVGTMFIEDVQINNISDYFEFVEIV